MNELIPYQDMKEMAAVMAKSGMFGKTPDQMLALFLVAQAEGLHPVRAAQDYDVIQGRPALKSQAALARFQEAGGRIEWTTRSETVAEAIFSHPQASPVTVRWDMDRAAKMGLASRDNWKKQPMIMLQWRVVAEGVRACYPACLNRMYLVEEVQDFDNMKTIPAEDASLIDVKNSRGELAPPSDPGEINPPRDEKRTRGKMHDLHLMLADIACAKYPVNGERVLTTDEIRDMNAEKHPGGRDLVPSDNDLALLQGIVDKYQAIVDHRIDVSQNGDSAEQPEIF